MRTDLFEIFFTVCKNRIQIRFLRFSVQQTLSKLCFSYIDLLHHGIGTLLFGLNICSAV